MFGGSDDRPGVVEGVGLAEAVESFGDAEPLPTLNGEAAVEASFDVEGEAEPGVAGSGNLGERAEAGREVFGGGRPVRNGSEPADAFAAEGFGDGGEVALCLVAVTTSEDGAGVAKSVDPVGERVVLVDDGEHSVGPVVRETAVDAGDLVVAPLVRGRPAPVLVDCGAGTTGERTIGA